MNDNSNVSEDERSEELSSVASIFPELVADPNDPYTATLDLPVTPIEPLRILFRPATDGAPLTPPTSAEQEQDNLNERPRVQQLVQLDSHNLCHLPPVTLRITLPEGYPTTKSPNVSLSVSPPWLPESTLKRLSEDVSRLWEEVGKDLVLYTYIVHLQEEAESAFRLAGPNLSLSSTLRLELLDFDLKTKQLHFERETFDCGICLEPKKGVNCHKLTLCGHVFCIACLQDFFKSCITEGDVDSIKCLSPDCGKNALPAAEGDTRPSKRRKQDRTLNPSELLQIPIDQELIQRYVRLKRKKRLEADKNTIYCPRQWCQGAARTKRHPKPVDPMSDSVLDSDSDSEDEPPIPDNLETLPKSQRLCVCEDCDFAFCCVCRKGWHGEFGQCNPRSLAELSQEEAASASYIQKYSTPCPTCNVRAQKTLGCNHMICGNCKTHFCYLCSSYLLADNPYRHFNDVNSPCYQRLWVLEAGDGEDVDVEAHFRINWEAAIQAQEDQEQPGAENGVPAEGVEDIEFELAQFVRDDDTSDEEPAPDIRRNRERHIEIVNFGGRGGHNAQRFLLPERAHALPVPAPPAAPNPPRRPRGRRGGGQQGNRQRAMRNEPARANRQVPNQEARLAAVQPVQPPVQAPVLAPAQDANHNVVNAEGQPLPGGLPLAAPGQGNNPGFAQGLERFLQLALDDQEDEWDSDELEDDNDGFGDEHFPDPEVRRRRIQWN
ncbi:hypothetical protein LTR84_012186 [Exophiala bonariae]|uniref:RBR-type E3 ubiquitin transferase n=1 Tax=Exophiala bonariae TaxID=1690606 RepID=A0AAV9NFW4_9EURO|nr:hypothetical protein LTR84_012186 [Exophiala bonariae]